MNEHPSWCVHRWPHPGHQCSAVHRRDCDCIPEAERPIVPKLIPEQRTRLRIEEGG